MNKKIEETNKNIEEIKNEESLEKEIIVRNIFGETDDEKSFTIKISKEEKGIDIKNKIYEKIGKIKNSQILIYRICRNLDDNIKLSDVWDYTDEICVVSVSIGGCFIKNTKVLLKPSEFF